ncbi:MAG: hypothetical protein GY749_34625 [Desulfobacteraceae bacterium]|nr:hypothetical protein [Desulfobacteraceae bacterium]
MNIIKKIFILAIVLCITGCFSLTPKVKKISYYSLEYNPPKISVPARLPHVIRIERFQVSPLYDSNKIIFKENRFKRDAYFFHKWWANPGDIVSYFLARDMKQSEIFKAVFAFDRNLPSTHVIEGVVDEFFEQDETDVWKAVLSVSITLVKESEPDVSKRILLQKKYSAKELCIKKNPRALAEAMSKAMSKVSENVIGDIYNTLKKRRK